jgi:hypothetical protein
MKKTCKDCNCRFRSLTVKKEEGLCVKCYYRKYGEYPEKVEGQCETKEQKKKWINNS